MCSYINVNSIFMPKIGLKDIRFYAFHGFYPEERVIGGYYHLDIMVETGPFKIKDPNDLEQTVNYEVIYSIAKQVMEKPTALLETVCQEITELLKIRFSTLRKIEISLRKMNPPLAGEVGAAVVEWNSNFEKKCGKCGDTLSCYSDGNCWCKGIETDEITLNKISNWYKGCLCNKCLESAKRIGHGN
jgi:7,8-dihydroneopterin aldolase/epimerase/oxygenase